MSETLRKLAPQRFAEWLCKHIANDKKFGRTVFRYHPRSDEHSKTICRLVLEDIVASCPCLAQHAQEGKIVAGINAPYSFPNGKMKTLDLAIGVPGPGQVMVSPLVAIELGTIKKLRIACEAKQCMTEHGKTQPRIFDELSSSHEIVHQGDRNAISAGVVVVNVADCYASPTRQVSGDGELIWTKHRQPKVTESMVRHLRGLVMRDDIDGVGFDAFATIVIDCDNVGACRLVTVSPAPQPGEIDHYLTFLERINQAYSCRFA